MTKHIIRRLIQAIPTFFGVTLLSYIIMSLAPGGPATLITFGFNPEGTNNSATIQRTLERYGLNDPWHIQYLTWLTGNDWMWWKNEYAVDPDTGEEALVDRPVSYGILRGDFGDSFFKRQPATDLVAQRLPASFELGVASLLTSLIIGIPLGLLAAIWHRSFFDNSTRILAVVANSVPSFWMGLLLLLLFSFTLDILPSGNRCDLTVYRREPCPPVYMRLEYLIMPTAVLAFGGIAGYSRFMRTSMLDTVHSDYVRTARSKGLRSRTIWARHAARNSLIPLATFLGPAIVSVIGGAVIIETIFTWPGLGLLFIEAVSARDFPIVMASVVIGSVLTIFAYIISDILYAVFDPRIRF